MLARLLKPSFSDFIFVAILCWMFVLAPDGFTTLLEDGDTGWHIRAGQWIIAHHAVPAHDLFSFSKPEAPWFAWEWLSDLLYAALYALAGLKAITLFAGAEIALFATLLVRMTIGRGASPGPALLASFLAVGASNIHYFARPHLATLLLVPLFAWLLDRHQSLARTQRTDDRLIWWLVPLTALWTNLHGGFLAGLTMIAIYCAGSAIEAVWHRAGAPIDWTATRQLALVGSACAVATLGNPYGYELHRHVLAYVSSDWIQNAVVEFRSPVFRGEFARQYEILLLAGLMASAMRLVRGSVAPSLLLVFWAHQSLTSVRHLTIYCAVAAPWIAVEATLLWRQLADRAARKSTVAVLRQLEADTVPNFAHTSLWPAAALVFIALAPIAHIHWPQDFPRYIFPVQFVAKHDARIRQAARLLTKDQWADYLIFHNYPEQRFYIDGRSDFYGEALGTEYTNLMTGHEGWRDTLARRQFDVALVPLDWPLANLLKRDPDWRVLDDDGHTLLFERKTPESLEPNDSHVAEHQPLAGLRTGTPSRE